MRNKNKLWQLVIICVSCFLCIANTEPKINFVTKDDVPPIVNEYIMNNPQVIIDAIAKYQNNQQRLIIDKIHNFIKKNKQQLEDIQNSPYAGPANASKTIIMFYDYSCGYCKSANDAINHLLATKKDIRVIYKPCALLGDSSSYLAKLILAVYLDNPDQFKPIHDALMNINHITKNIVVNIITKHGLDYKKIELELNSKKVNDRLKQISTQSARVFVRGVPAFIINDEVYPGLLNLGDLIRLVDTKTSN